MSEYINETSIQSCPVERAMTVIAGKWKPVLLFHLVSGAKRYSELQRLVSNASDRMLTRSLRELEHDQLVHREIFAEVPARVEYTLTDNGRTLYPIMAELSKWGTHYSETVTPSVPQPSASNRQAN